LRFRDFLKTLKEEKELVEVTEPVSWNVEVGAIGARSIELGGPALHFTNIKDYPGMSLVTGLYASYSDHYPHKKKAWYRLFRAMGRTKEFTYEGMQALFAEALDMKGIKGVEVTKGPCKEVIRRGDEVNLFELPFPKIHEVDGGRYITLATVICRDPETGYVCWSNERAMIKDRNTLVVNIRPWSPLNEILPKYEGMRKPMPAAIALGTPSTVPIGVSIAERGYYKELSPEAIAGYLDRTPIELIRAETSDLLVPADAEVIIEGEFVPGARELEGPYPGHWRLEPPSPQPVMKVTAITRRKDPIIPFDVGGIKHCDSMTLEAIGESFKVYRTLNTWWWGTRVARWVYLPIGYRMGICIVSGMTLYPGFEYHYGAIVTGCTNFCDKILLVDDSLGAEELARVMQDLIQKASPVHAFHFSKPDAHVAPYSAKYPRALKTGRSGRLIINATFDPTWPPELIPTRVSFETSFPKDIQEKVIKEWHELGFTEPAERRLISR